MKRISIIIPCYNTAGLLHRCMSSLAAQTIGIDNMEIILVNDASTDDNATWQEILNWEKLYPESIIAVSLPENLRQGGARNAGMSYASADYIGFVDSDDWVEPNMYEILLDEIIESGSEIVYCKAFRDDGTGTMPHLLDGSYQRLLIDSEDKRKMFIATNCIGYNVWDKIYRRSFLIEHNIVFPEKLMYEDIIFSSLYYLYADRVSIINYELYHYYINPESTVLKKNAAYHADMLTIARLRILEYHNCNVWHKYHDEIEFELIMSCYLAALKIMFLRYDNVPYEAFLNLQEIVRTNSPDCIKNQYIKKFMPEKYRILMDLLINPVSREELEEIKKIYLTLK